MDLASTQLVAAPVDTVWETLTRFESHEARLRTRGATIDRSAGNVGEGTTWDTAFALGGTVRKAAVTLVRLDAPRCIRLDASGTGLKGSAEIVLTAIDAGQTEVGVTTGLSATSMGGRVILQPLKLAKGRLQQQLDEQVSRIARRIEAQHRGDPA